MLSRSFELRDAEIKGRTLELACVPFDREAWVSDHEGEYREVFRHGAFAGVINDPRRTQLRYAHSEDLKDRLGIGLELREDAAYLHGAFRVTQGERGDHLLDLVRSGDLAGVSVGFMAGASRRTGDLVERLRVKQLVEVSLVDAPAYQEAEVLAVRQARELDAERARLRAWADAIRAAAL